MGAGKAVNGYNIFCYQKEKYANSGRGYRLLILLKSGFFHDAKACFEGREQFGLYYLSRYFAKCVAEQFLPADLNEFTYKTENPIIEASTHELRQYWIKILSKVNIIIKIDAVVTGNFGYKPEQEFAIAL